MINAQSVMTLSVFFLSVDYLLCFMVMVVPSSSFNLKTKFYAVFRISNKHDVLVVLILAPLFQNNPSLSAR